MVLVLLGLRAARPTIRLADRPEQHGLRSWRVRYVCVWGNWAIYYATSPFHAADAMRASAGCRQAPRGKRVGGKGGKEKGGLGVMRCDEM